MKMVRHHDECVQTYMREVVWYRRPTRVNDLPRVIQAHHAVGHVPEQTDPIIRADCDEIDPLAYTIRDVN